jgi:glycogen debranching enzyme
LTTELDTGPYPYAGIPWFSTPFGRDAIITAWQVLWIEPSLARGVLSYLAEHQAVEVSAFRDSAPGKIMHETRKGEMTALGELPFGRYYGGVDTTPICRPGLRLRRADRRCCLCRDPVAGLGRSDRLDRAFRR